jgi:octaprenyl-diphosphate synthase
LRNAPPAVRARTERSIRSGEVFDGQWPLLAEFVRTHGGIEYAMARARAFGRDAKAALLRLGPTPEREALAAAVDFIIRRYN